MGTLIQSRRAFEVGGFDAELYDDMLRGLLRDLKVVAKIDSGLPVSREELEDANLIAPSHYEFDEANLMWHPKRQQE